MNIEKIINDNIENNKYAPAYENNISTKMPGYNVIFTFPTCPIEEEKTIMFAAYVKKVTDSFSPEFEQKKVYGRMDKIPIYSSTSRAISFDLDIPSNGLAHSREIARKLNILARNTYPSYEVSAENSSVNIVSSPPLVRIFFSSFINSGQTKSDNSLLGYFTKAIDIVHDIEKGVFVRKEGYEAYAKTYSLSFSFNVLHEYTPGYIKTGVKPAENSINILRSVR